MVVAGTVLFLLAWGFAPGQGLAWRRFRRDGEPVTEERAAALDAGG